MPRVKNKDKRVKSLLRLYLDSIGETPLLNHEEEIDLGKRIEKGDAEARQHLIKANLRLVVSVAKKYTRRSLILTLLGLINEGNIGLIYAVDHFDWRRGFRFSSYAVPCIEGKIKNALSYEKRGSEVKFSLDYLTGTKEEGDMYEFIEDEKAVSPRSSIEVNYLGEIIKEGLFELETTERRIIELSFGLFDGIALSIKEISRELGIKTKKVRQIREVSLRKLKIKLKQ